jgi:S1-C subfamily serine protease
MARAMMPAWARQGGVCAGWRNVIPLFAARFHTPRRRSRSNMSKAPLYSRSRRHPGTATPPASVAEPATAAVQTPAVPAAPPGWRGRLRAWSGRQRTPLAALAGALVATLALLVVLGVRPGQRVITQDDIDQAVRASLEKEPLPSAAAKAYEAIAPSVVRVVGLMDDSDAGEDDAEQRAMERSLGTGVVIIDNGTILTNLHVVAGAKKVKVRFANGHESEAHVVGTQPENDLAVLKAASLPDDLEAATMRSTADLRPGDEVIAVGHPFGIGPSVSAGVVSGLRREFRTPEGEKKLTNLIQFDAAANPGNSGGPLVTMDGHVVGIVTAILNPGEQRTFIGIGFAVPIENAASAAGMPPF